MFPGEAKHLVQNILGSESCCFDDVTKLPPARAKCRAHPQGACSLRSGLFPNEKEEGSVYGLTSGFSCKSFSRANVGYRTLRTAWQEKRIEAPSVATFFGTTECIENLSDILDFFVLENVDSIGKEEEESSNLAMALQELRSIRDGTFCIKVFRLCSASFGLPQALRFGFGLGFVLFFQVLADGERKGMRFSSRTVGCQAVPVMLFPFLISLVHKWFKLTVLLGQTVSEWLLEVYSFQSSVRFFPGVGMGDPRKVFQFAKKQIAF